jgi:hypothetical protein
VLLARLSFRFQSLVILFFTSIWINIIIVLPSTCIIFFIIRCIRQCVIPRHRAFTSHLCAAQRRCCRHRRGGDAGAGMGGFWLGQESLFEMSHFQRGPPPPLVPVIISVFFLEDDAGEPGVCEVAVASSPDESSVPLAVSFYDECQAAAVLRQA